jgi:D-alanyl-lipoteichoic acid acyltransferase DltB (MBOAT superfamily)
MTTSKDNAFFYKVGIVFNLLQLLLLRYASFTIDPFLSLLNSDVQVSLLSKLIIPIGISYFTLQGVGYLVNIKMAWETPEKNFMNLFLYFIFYPKFLSGPIERSNHFLPQIKKEKVFVEGNVVIGFRLLLFGLFKKIVIANKLAPYLQQAYEDIDKVDGWSLWILLLLQPLYLYFDFSGYTDIARGFARLFGIKLLPNFNKPFLANSVTNFWKRFHISLAAWFNDYVFKRTMFKYRKWGNGAVLYALLLTWVLFGIWHGAGWNFMLLGFIQAIAVTYEYYTKKQRISLYAKLHPSARILIGRTATYLFYSVSLVFFFSPDLNVVINFFSGLFSFNGIPALFTPISVQPYMVGFYIAIILLVEYIHNDVKSVSAKVESFWFDKSNVKKMIRWTIYSVMLTLILMMQSEVEQFVYVNF